MGNCMEPLRDRRVEEKREEVNIFGKDRDSFVKDDNEIMSNNNNNKSGGDSGVVRVKVVMTKEELQWLMMELSKSNGSQGATSNDKRSIEDVLGELEIKQGRKRSLSFASTHHHHHHAWKPSLESIPEFLEMST